MSPGFSLRKMFQRKLPKAKLLPSKPTVLSAYEELTALRRSGVNFLPAYRQASKNLSREQKIALLRRVESTLRPNQSEFYKAIKFELKMLGAK